MNRVAILQHKTQFILHFQSPVRFHFKLYSSSMSFQASTAPEQHRRWLVNLWREGFKLTKFSNICSAHFEDSFINRTDQIVQSSPGSLQMCAEVNVFVSLNNHMFDSTCLSNHMFSLIKCCSQCYSKIKMCHLGKQHTHVLHIEKLERGYQN